MKYSTQIEYYYSGNYKLREKTMKKGYIIGQITTEDDVRINNTQRIEFVDSTGGASSHIRNDASNDLSLRLST